jgi:hypothetical protein
MDVPKEFFTLQSMLTLAGSTGATFVVANGIQRAFNYNPKWLALLIAQIIVNMGVYLSHGQGSDYFIGIVNAFLVYCTAAGATSVAGGGRQADLARGSQTISGAGPRQFLSSWF